MSENIFGQIAQTGILGAILAWFMLRLEGILKENTQALYALTTMIKLLCDQNAKASKSKDKSFNDNRD